MKLQLQHCTVHHGAASAGAPAALNDISLEFDRAEQIAVIGPSGAGKTTLLHLLACAIRPDQGSLQLDGQAPWQLPRPALRGLRGRLFLAPQVPPLPPRQRVVTAVLAARLPQMGFFAALRSLLYPTQAALAQTALAAFDMADKLFVRVDRLSGGERQRVALARLLASDATLLLVDEPLSALDPTRAQQALAVLVQTARQRQATLVVSLHQVDMALGHFSRIVGLRHGRVQFDLPTAQVSADVLRALYADTPATLDADQPAQPPQGDTLAGALTC